MIGSVIISARRSAVAPRNGAFSNLSIEALASPVVLAALSDAGLAVNDVDELIAANSLAGGGNPARIVALAAGLPLRVAGLTIDRQCVGGLDAIILGDVLIRSGQSEVVVVGGVESYSRRPLRYQTFADGREPRAYDQAQFTPWAERDPEMAAAAEALAQCSEISREAQDLWAVESHAKAIAAGPNGTIVAIEGVAEDMFTRKLTAQHCKRAKGVTGGITSANMAVAADAAAFVVMTSVEFARARGLSGLQVLAGRTLGDNPELPGLAPVAAIEAVLEAAQLSSHDLAAVEIMEAFAVQAIACQDAAGIPAKLVNSRGGALARGHPIGASGAILAVNLFQQLQRQGQVGLATIAAAGGLGTAVAFRRI